MSPIAVILRCVFVVSLASLPLMAVTPFEGVATVQITTSSVIINQLTLKGKRARMLPPAEVVATNGYPLLDFEQMKVRFIAPRTKSYFEMPLAIMENNVRALPPALSGPTKGNAILNHEVQVFQCVDGVTGATIRISATADLSVQANFMLGFQRFPDYGLIVAKAARILIAEKNLFPLQIVVTSKKGAQLLCWEVTKLEAKTVDPAELTVPAGYQKVSALQQATAPSK